MSARIKETYVKQVAPRLLKEREYPNVMAVPRLKKIVVNMAATVTLRGDRMYEFCDRLFNVALPRVRDFRGVPTNSFDGRGNYTLGLKDQLIFPEVDYAKVDKMRGMNVTFVT